MMIVFMCYEDNNHLFKVKSNCCDGISCPICKGVVGTTQVDKSVLDKIPYYEDLKQYQHKAECLTCGHREMIFHSKENYQEVRVCPKCKGALVDDWHKHKYLNDTNSQIEITMTNPNEPPKIKLNGKDIEGIISLDYKYETLDGNSQGQHNFTVKYCDKDDMTIRTISVSKIWEG